MELSEKFKQFKHDLIQLMDEYGMEIEIYTDMDRKGSFVSEIIVADVENGLSDSLVYQRHIGKQSLCVNASRIEL
jgi:5S rRNA maturation endonuclease (ribonuclease M5)